MTDSFDIRKYVIEICALSASKQKLLMMRPFHQVKQIVDCMVALPGQLCYSKQISVFLVERLTIAGQYENN